MSVTGKNPWRRLGGRLVVAPSLLACDFTRMGEQVAEVVLAGATVLHADVMDGHFVGNLAISPSVVASLRARTDRLLDVHLMVTDPMHFAGIFAEAGADSISFHIEADGEAEAMVDRLRELGVGAGVVLKPETPAEAIAPVAGSVDLVLVMTVEPGYGGQAFMGGQVAKIRAIRRMVGPGVRVEVDGGIDDETGPVCAGAGADTFVAGESIFGEPDIFGAFRSLEEAIRGPVEETT